MNAGNALPLDEQVPWRYQFTMQESFLQLFNTPLGRCGIAWGENGITACTFPEVSDDETRARLRRRARDGVETDEAPAHVRSAIGGIVRLMQGEKETLQDVVLDFSGIPEFEEKVYRLSRAIPPGETRSYGALARELGDVAYSQRVGQCLGRNPFPIIVPCHRIVGADGKLTGFSAPGGIETKRALLKIEGAIDRDLFDLMDQVQDQSP
jgi:methylated-DNA-[protein]-cysteine S-methyltransferase